MRGAVGVRGDLRIGTHTGEAAAIAAYGPVKLGLDGPEVRVRIVRSQGDVVVGRIAGVTTRDAAERLKGTALYVARAALPEPEPDSFYHHDLVGLAVEDGAGRPLGRVAAVHNFGAGDLLEIARDGGNIMIPFTKEAVPLVDLAAGRLVAEVG